MMIFLFLFLHAQKVDMVDKYIREKYYEHSNVYLLEESSTHWRKN